MPDQHRIKGNMCLVRLNNGRWVLAHIHGAHAGTSVSDANAKQARTRVTQLAAMGLAAHVWQSPWSRVRYIVIDDPELID